jgi:hypothetical protein
MNELNCVEGARLQARFGTKKTRIIKEFYQNEAGQQLIVT